MSEKKEIRSEEKRADCLLPPFSPCSVTPECRTCGWNRLEHERRVQNLRTRENVALRQVQMPDDAGLFWLESLQVQKNHAAQ